MSRHPLFTGWSLPVALGLAVACSWLGAWWVGAAALGFGMHMADKTRGDRARVAGVLVMVSLLVMVACIHWNFGVGSSSRAAVAVGLTFALILASVVVTVSAHDQKLGSPPDR